MGNVDRYPTWVLLFVTIVLGVAVVLRYAVLDRGSNPRRLWLMLMAAWLAAIGLVAAGLVRSRSGQQVTPNEGLLVLADFMAALLVISVPVGRAMRRLPSDRLRLLRPNNAFQVLLGNRGAFAVMVLLLGTMAGLLAGESALAAELPGPAAATACQDYTTWMLDPANNSMPPRADQRLLTEASQVAPPGDLRSELAALAANVQSAISGNGTIPGILDETRIISEEGTVSQHCTSVQGSG
jgi:hypothetical protein